MLTQIRILTKLELCNLYGLNVLRFSKDKKSKQKNMGLMALWIILLVMLICYVGGLTYALIYLGLEDAVPAYLITVSGLLIFFFGMLKAGNIIFQREGYDILCALPLRTGAIAVSRLMKMYVEDLLMALAVLLPGIGVYIWNIRPGTGFYLAVLLGTWIIPLIPMAASILMGTLITGISSRMRHKSLLSAGQAHAHQCSRNIPADHSHTKPYCRRIYLFQQRHNRCRQIFQHFGIYIAFHRPQPGGDGKT